MLKENMPTTTKEPIRFISFVGWNCHELDDPINHACRGWDQENRRCDCGNRRVGWNEDYTIAEAW